MAKVSIGGILQGVKGVPGKVIGLLKGLGRVFGWIAPLFSKFGPLFKWIGGLFLKLGPLVVLAGRGLSKLGIGAGTAGSAPATVGPVAEAIRWFLVMIVVPVLVVLVAAKSGNLSDQLTASWLVGLFLMGAVLSLVINLVLKKSVWVGFSLASLVLLYPLMIQFRFSDILVGYMVSAVLAILIAFIPHREKIDIVIPKEVMVGMVAGVLIRYESGLFPAFTRAPVLIGLVLLFYLFSRQITRGKIQPIGLAVLAGLVASLIMGPPNKLKFVFDFSLPEIQHFAFDWKAIVSISIPLLLANMGLLHPDPTGLKFPTRFSSVFSGIGNLILAPFGGFGVVVNDRSQGSSGGMTSLIPNVLGLLIAALFAYSMVFMLRQFSFSMIRVLVGLALLPLCLQTTLLSLAKGESRLGGIIALIVAASNIPYLGISSLVWALTLGTLAHHLGDREWHFRH